MHFYFNPYFECSLPYWLRQIALPCPTRRARRLCLLFAGVNISSSVTKSWFHQQSIGSCSAPGARLPREVAPTCSLCGHVGASVAIRITFKWKMSFSKAADVQWSAVHEQLTSPGVSASVSVLCELGVREKSVQDGGVEGLYLCSDCTAVMEGLGRNRKSTWGRLN